MNKRVSELIRLPGYYCLDTAGQSRDQYIHKRSVWLKYATCLIAAILPVMIPLTESSSWAQTEVTSNIYRYTERERSSRSYERYEVKPRIYQVFVRGGIPQREAVTLSPGAEKVRRRKYLGDSHRGLKFYERLTCIQCHPRKARNLHSIRAKITCRQCHGPEPIAGLSHYYSKMNPRRRHAFVCAKCHEGANASFASYVNHEPNPAALSTRQSFPLLFYVFWMMAAIAVGTFAAFLPHAFMWGLREFLPDSFLSGLTKRFAGRWNQDGQD